MPYLKLDTGILRSSLWFDRDQRDVFLTALLMAEPHEIYEETPTYTVEALTESPFTIPPGWYGMVHAAGPGIVDAAKVEQKEGMAALAKLGQPDSDSRSQEFEGRRLVRVDGGYIVLNFMKYRDRDHSAATRQQRYRDRKKAASQTSQALHRDVTQRHAISKQEAVSSKQKTKEKGATPPKEKRALRTRTPGMATPSNKNSDLSAAYEFIQIILDEAEFKNGRDGERFIRTDRIKKLGPQVLATYKKFGGQTRFLQAEANGKELSILATHIAATETAPRSNKEQLTEDAHTTA